MHSRPGKIEMGLGPLLHMMGLFHAVISACGKITINFTSTREMIADPAFYRECLEESFEELRTAAGESVGAASSGDWGWAYSQP